MKGIFINLDRCTERKKSLLSQLDTIGIPSKEYLRFSAIEPTGDEPELTKGLKSKGELGLFKSLVAVLAQIGDGDFFDDVVHVLEDDACFPDGFARDMPRVLHSMLSNPQLRNVDIIFLDYFLNRPLFTYVESRRANLAPGLHEMIPGKSNYIACTGSFLIRRSSASYLSRMLAKTLETSDSLVPVDFMLRRFLRLGVLNGYLVVPPLCAPGWEQDDLSTIQTHADDATRLSQRSHLLLRLLASGIKSPFWCAQKLEEMYDLPSPLAPNDDAKAFLSYFDSLKEFMPDF